MLKVDNLHTHYGPSHILHGIALEAAAGEVVGIFGRNGAGKTTLLKTIAGWVKPSEGGVSVDKEEIGHLPPEKVCRRGIGFVPEDRRIFPGLTVEENISLALLQGAGMSSAEERASLDRIYTRFPRLQERRKQIGTSLSGGEQQMLAMARAIVCRPRLLLIDEPTEGLAPMIVDEIFKLIAELRAAGTTILLVEQNLHAALAASDRFYVIERGRVVESGVSRVEADQERLYAAIAV
ncbi:ABC transporter ATP-binding protein [Noviherbaspirillum denitrificans]|uniref:ABC transporter ATP-binding protein n=1 Tax=Noviherbaspirillum denitrificans TaxID=1968433 RepID=A0A254T978_9BURK|nr:ABC transporter ATP-binding protein [Noviherbaspirillum denitrificans]OWW18717.1 ABC transporter ATP-binding protein [Noviherbaspirillum denitrificans]